MSVTTCSQEEHLIFKNDNQCHLNQAELLKTGESVITESGGPRNIASSALLARSSTCSNCLRVKKLLKGSEGGAGDVAQVTALFLSLMHLHLRQIDSLLLLSKDSCLSST